MRIARPERGMAEVVDEATFITPSGHPGKVNERPDVERNVLSENGMTIVQTERGVQDKKSRRAN